MIASIPPRYINGAGQGIRTLNIGVLSAAPLSSWANPAYVQVGIRTRKSQILSLMPLPLGYLHTMGLVGIEPTIHGLKVRYLTAWSQARTGMVGIEPTICGSKPHVLTA